MGNLAAKQSLIDPRCFDFEAEMHRAMVDGVWTVMADAFERRSVAESVRHQADEYRRGLRVKAAQWGGNPTWTQPATSPQARQRETKREQIIAFLLSGATNVRRALRERRQLAPTPVRRAARAPRRHAARSAAATSSARAGTGDGDPAPDDARLDSRVALPRHAAVGGER
jgi:hypothetical protein